MRRHESQWNKHQQSIADRVVELIRAKDAAIIGPIRQELLTGISDTRYFARLRIRMRDFTDESLVEEDYENAAEMNGICRKNGIVGSQTDFLICAVSVARKMRIFTLDKDFDRFAKKLPIELL